MLRLTPFSFDAQEPLDYSDVVTPTPTADTNDNVQPLDQADEEVMVEKNDPTLRIGAEGTTAASEALSTVINLHLTKDC